MRRLLIFLSLLAILSLVTSACSEHTSNRGDQEETAQIDRLKKAEGAAMKSIQQAKEEAIDSINSVLNEKLQSNTKIQSNRIILIAIIWPLVLVMAALYFSKKIKTRKSNPEANVLDYEQKQLIKDWIKEECEKAFSPNDKTNTTKPQDIEHIVHNFCYDDNFKEYIQEIAKEAYLANKPNATISSQEELKQAAEHLPLQTERPTDKRCIFYARESRTKELEISSKDYQRGKSLYKLILDNPDSPVATLDLCLNEEGAVEQIIKRDIQYLGVICSVNQKTYTPTTVKVIEKGIAEKRDNNIWEVTKQIKVEFE